MLAGNVPRVLASPTSDRVAVNQALDQLAARGGTGTGEAIQSATNILTHQPGVRGKRPPSAIVLISDGTRSGVGRGIASVPQPVINRCTSSTWPIPSTCPSSWASVHRVAVLAITAPGA